MPARAGHKLARDASLFTSLYGLRWHLRANLVDARSDIPSTNIAMERTWPDMQRMPVQRSFST